MIDVLNLGAGVQSSTVLLMSLEGELPKIDHAIFADTGWEPPAVYQQLEWLEKKAEASGVKVHIVRQGNIKERSLQSHAATCKEEDVRAPALPYFLLGADGSHGHMNRQCTDYYKIRPIETFIKRELLGLKFRERHPTELRIVQWFGISWDEAQRMRTSQHKWSKHFYPLVDLQMDRTACFLWLERHGYPEPPRSACIGCPFRHNREWREMKANRPAEWEDAVEFDRAIRNHYRFRSRAFLHSDRKPLAEANLWKDCDENQLPLFDMVDECSGMCGV